MTRDQFIARQSALRVLGILEDGLTAMVPVRSMDTMTPEEVRGWTVGQMQVLVTVLRDQIERGELSTAPAVEGDAA